MKKRQKQKLLQMTALFLAAGMLTACGNKKEVKKTELSVDGIAQEATLLLKEDGSVQSAIQESFDKDYYDKTELRTFIADQLSDYTKEHGADSVSLGDVGVADKQAVAIFSYPNVGSYAEFNEVSAALVSVKEASDQGALEGDFTDMEGNVVTSDKITKESENQVLIFEGGTRFESEAPIECVKGATLIDDYTADISGSAVIVIGK